MSFQIEFRPAPKTHRRMVSTEEPQPSDDPQTAVIKACALLAERGESTFVFRGFGRDPWPVDVAYDLSAVLEQLDDLVRELRDGRPVSIDLYTQGIESDLDFEPQGDIVEIRCRTRTNWTPNPSIEEVGRHLLLAMLADLAKQVATGLEMIDPRLILVPPFDNWAKGVC